MHHLSRNLITAAALLACLSGCGRAIEPFGRLEPDAALSTRPAPYELANGRWSLTVEIERPEDGRFVHVPGLATGPARRWFADDVFLYEATLKVLSAEGVFVDVASPSLTLEISARTPAEANATFSGLKAQDTYQIVLLAKGSAGGLAPERTLNQDAPTRSTFDATMLSRGARILTATMRVALDAVPFNGQTEAPMGDVTDGSWTGPSGPLSGIAR